MSFFKVSFFVFPSSFNSIKISDDPRASTNFYEDLEPFRRSFCRSTWNEGPQTEVLWHLLNFWYFLNSDKIPWSSSKIPENSHNLWLIISLNFYKIFHWNFSKFLNRTQSKLLKLLHNSLNFHNEKKDQIADRSRFISRIDK